MVQWIENSAYLVTKYALERGEPSGGLAKRVLCIFCPGEVLAPAVLVLVAVRPQVSPNFLYLVLSLAVGLWVVTGGKTYRDS